MKLLLVSVFLVLAYAQAEDSCGYLYPLIVPDPDPAFKVNVTDINGTAIEEVRNNMAIKVHVTFPETSVKVHCLLGIGQPQKWRQLMPNACQSVNSTTARNTEFTFILANVNTTRDDWVDIRVGVQSNGDYRRTKYEGVLRYKYTVLESEERPTSPTPIPATPSTTTPVPVVDQNKEDDPHDSRMEANLAAKWAEMQRKMAEDEDRNSEGAWQQLEEEEKRKHEEEVQKEQEEYEAKEAEERKRREEMIRQEMMDKEENERLEFEARRKSTTPMPMEKDVVEEDENEVVDVNNNNIVVRAGAPSHTGLVPLLVVLASMVAAILM